MHCWLRGGWTPLSVTKITGYPPTYAEDKKMKALALDTHNCLGEWSSSSSLNLVFRSLHLSYEHVIP